MSTKLRVPLFLWLALTLMLVECVTLYPENERGAETAPEGLTALDEAALQDTGRPVSFTQQVRPILESKCYPCHNHDGSGKDNSGRRAFNMTREQCAQRIVPGNPGQSLFLALSSTHQNLASMPPVGNRLTERESKILAQWISEGAHWPKGRSGLLRESASILRPEH